MNLFKLNKNIEINKYCKSLHFQEDRGAIHETSEFLYCNLLHIAILSISIIAAS